MYALLPMLWRPRRRTLASMNNHAEIAPLNWSELAVSELPTGTVTLLLADVEGSTRLWDNQPAEMAAAVGRLEAVVSELVTAHGGVRPLEQGEGDSFVAAFPKASDAVACALALQRTALEPIRLRIGLHTGEIQLRDDSNYAGPTINRAARIRDLAHGGQTVLSGATEAMVLDRLPPDAWLADLGSHALRDLPRAERVLQLNHPELPVDFPALRVTAEPRRSRLPLQLTSFVGRVEQIAAVRELLSHNRLVTLTGAGGAGKTRLAIRIAALEEPGFDGEVFFVDLAPITDPAVVPVAVARALQLTDQPGRTTIDAIRWFVAGRKLLVVLDNCEHLLDACSAVVTEMLDAGGQVSVLATSREPIGMPGELTWLVPSLSTDHEAVELFVDRARCIRADFAVTAEHTATLTEICRRLDGMPLAIELAAARTRTLSLAQILDGLRTNFRLLTGGARTAVRRQQTLAASIDWSHSLLTDPERNLFRRLVVFAGGFDLEAAHWVGSDTDRERVQLIDVLGLLVDKSLVVADDSGGSMRYRLLETVRQYALEKLAAAGEADAVRTRHRDYYAHTAAALGSQARGDDNPMLAWAHGEMDNLRAAHAWSCEIGDFATALSLVTALHKLWLGAARFREGLAGYNSVFSDERYADDAVSPAIWVRAVAHAAQLAVWLAVPASLERAQEALDVAREFGDQRLLARILMGCGMLSWDRPELAGPYLDEAVAAARAADDLPALSEALGYQTFAAFAAGDPVKAHTAGEEGYQIADLLEERSTARYCKTFFSMGLFYQGKLQEARATVQGALDSSRADGDRSMEALALQALGQILIFGGDCDAGEAAGLAALEIANDMGGFHDDTGSVVVAGAALARGDAEEARRACEEALQRTYALKGTLLRSILPMADALLYCGDHLAARRWADETVTLVPGMYQAWALLARARVALAQSELIQAETDAHDALAVIVRTEGYLRVPEALELVAALADETNALKAARLLGAAQGIRQRHGGTRFAVFDADYERTVARLCELLGTEAFEAAWTEGEALDTSAAVALAQRGRGERKRPASGWGALTPAELDVVNLLSEGLSNKDIAARLFVSPRTVQTHLTHIYGKLNLSSRVQVVQEAARH